jgi:pyruvate kinase
MSFVCPTIPCLRCRTKIVCTLGPSTDAPGVVERMIEAGMAVARINFSHGTAEENAQRIRSVREAAARYSIPLGILADLQGPKLRIGAFARGKVDLAVGQEFWLLYHPAEGDETKVHVPHPEVLDAIAEGSRVLLGDGDIELVARQRTTDGIACEVVVGGSLASRKGITVPGVKVHLPVVTEKDRADLTVALREKVDYVALSFVQEASDVEVLRGLIHDAGQDVPIVAKIERRSAIEEFDSVLAAADAVMVARGDLGLEVPAEEVPIYQKELIAKAKAAGKPVITATQMLESMMTNPRPTRAEASDVANAIVDGTDAVMLSGETAAGRYPVEAVRMMRRIASFTEANLPEPPPESPACTVRTYSVTEAISQATCHIAKEVGARAIVAATMSGWTARMVAKERPEVPIVAITPNPEVVGRLTLVWGVAPMLVETYQSSDAVTDASLEVARLLNLVKDDDLVVLTAGMPLGGPGRTNTIRVHRPSEAKTATGG